MPGAESILEAEEVSGFAADPAEATVEAAGRRIGGQWRDAVYQRSEWRWRHPFRLDLRDSCTSDYTKFELNSIFWGFCSLFFSVTLTVLVRATTCALVTPR